MKKIDYNVKDIPDLLHMNSVVSSNDCTGLVPNIPEDEGNAESYSKIYDIPKQEGLEKLVQEKEIAMDNDK